MPRSSFVHSHSLVQGQEFLAPQYRSPEICYAVARADPHLDSMAFQVLQTSLGLPAEKLCSTLNLLHNLGYTVSVSCPFSHQGGGI